MFRLFVLLFLMVWVFPLPAKVDPAQRAEIEQAIADENWKAAVKQAKKLVKKQPKESEAHYLLALAIKAKMESVSQVRAMMNIGDYNDALDEALELQPDNVEALTEQIGFLIFAPGIAGGDKDEARKKIAELKTRHPLEAMQMTVLLARVEEDTAAEKTALTELIRLEPEAFQHPIRMAWLLAGEGQLEQADQHLASVQAQAAPDYQLAALYQRARWRIVNNQDVAAAVPMLEQYIQQHDITEIEINIPSVAAAYWRLGLARELLGQNQEALSSMAKSVELDSEMKEAKADYKRLNKKVAALSD